MNIYCVNILGFVVQPLKMKTKHNVLQNITFECAASQTGEICTTLIQIRELLHLVLVNLVLGKYNYFQVMGRETHRNVSFSTVAFEKSEFYDECPPSHGFCVT